MTPNELRERIGLIKACATLYEEKALLYRLLAEDNRRLATAQAAFLADAQAQLDAATAEAGADAQEGHP